MDGRTDGCTDGRTDDRQKVITIAHPEHSSGELTKLTTRKKVKCQCTTIILATLVDLLFPMIYVKIQPQGILGFGEEDF